MEKFVTSSKKQKVDKETDANLEEYDYLVIPLIIR